MRSLSSISRRWVVSVTGVALVSLACGSTKLGTGPADTGTGQIDGAHITIPGDGGHKDGTSPGDGGHGVIVVDAGIPASQSVLQRGNDLYRRSTFVEPALTLGAVPSMAWDTTFNANATFMAATNANPQNQGNSSVLYLEEGPAAAGCPSGATGCVATSRPAGNGLFFAFPQLGANPNVVAFDETTGQAVWSAHVTTGGDGIRGTAVIDPVSRRLFVVSGNGPHLVHALAVDTGVEATTGGWPVTLSSTTVSYNGVTFNSSAQNQHGATLLANNILYIPFGGEYGDGGNYLGWVIAVDITNPSNVAGWATQSARSGIWGAGGLASDGTSVFAVTGDTGVIGGTMAVPRNVSDSQEVVRLTGMASFTRSAENVFVPTEWMGWDRPAGDLDFGASTPTYVPLPQGSTPAALLIAPAKAGRVYFLDGTNLSSGTYDPTDRTPGGELAEVLVSGLDTESVYTTPTVYDSASGLHATIDVGQGGPYCPGGTPASKEMILSLLISPGQTPLAKIAWCSPVASGGGHYNFTPMSTTTNGVSDNALVWFMDGTALVAVNGDTGKRVYTSTGAGCPNVPSMSTPIAVKNHVVVAALGQLCSWSLGGS